MEISSLLPKHDSGFFRNTHAHGRGGVTPAHDLTELLDVGRVGFPSAKVFLFSGPLDDIRTDADLLYSFPFLLFLNRYIRLMSKVKKTPLSATL